jgi:nitrate reductase cytochrome c-type subunit
MISHRRYVFWLIPAALLFMLSCNSGKAKVYREKGLATGQPGMNIYTGKEPGETAPLQRPYPNAPPLIPHKVAGLTIDRAQNDCLDCHLEGMEVEKGHISTKIPLSHFKNEHTGVVKKGRVVGIRYNCIQCHVPQSEEKPPVPQMTK